MTMNFISFIPALSQLHLLPYFLYSCFLFTFTVVLLNLQITLTFPTHSSIVVKAEES